MQSLAQGSFTGRSAPSSGRFRLRLSAASILDSAIFWRSLPFIGLAVLWEALTSSGDLLLIPSFTGTVAATIELLLNPELWSALLISNQALVLGFGISVVLGVPIGLAMGRFRRVDRFTNVYVNILLVTPTAALIPVMLMSVGIGLAARVLVIILFTLTMIVVHTRAGMRQVDPHLIEMAQSFCATERKIWSRILLPSTLPAMMTGIRIGLGRAITGMVYVELLLVAVGIGNLLLRFQNRYEPELLWGVIVIIVLEALLLTQLARWIEARLAPWAAPWTAV